MKSAKHLIVVIALLMNIQLALHAQSKKAAVPPEIAKTVNSFRGHWILKGTDIEPGSTKPTPMTAVMDCESVALGNAVRCRLKSDDHSELASLIGYSPDEGVVRLMEISSAGANHVHTGPWDGNVIRFEKLSYTEAGEKRVETFAIGFPSPGKMTVRSVTETAEGTDTMDLVGTRRSTVK